MDHMDHMDYMDYMVYMTLMSIKLYRVAAPRSWRLVILHEVLLQVVHLAVYVFFAVSLVGEQWIIWKQEGDEEVDLYYPVFMTVR